MGKVSFFIVYGLRFVLSCKTSKTFFKPDEDLTNVSKVRLQVDDFVLALL